jgi:hypothetical protein
MGFISWFKKKEPIQTGMDKHTQRYMDEQFLHYEEFSFEKAIQCISNGNLDWAYLSSAIDSTFTGEQKQYLQQKVWDKRYGF